MSDIRESAEAFMRNDLHATKLAWEIKGPPLTAVTWLQGWFLPDSRLIIVEIYEDGGFDVFPLVRLLSKDNTRQFIERMESLELECKIETR